MQRLSRRSLALPRLLQARHELVKGQFQLRNLRLILVNVLTNFQRALSGLFQITILALPQFMGVLDRLLEPSDF